MLVISLCTGGDARGLPVERMELAVPEHDRVRHVLVVMRQRAIPLRHVEAEDTECDRADELLLEWALLLVRDLVPTCRRDKNRKLKNYQWSKQTAYLSM